MSNTNINQIEKKMMTDFDSKQRSPASKKRTQAQNSAASASAAAAQDSQQSQRSPDRTALNRNGNQLLYKQRPPTMRDIQQSSDTKGKPPAAHLKGLTINLGTSQTSPVVNQQKSISAKHSSQSASMDIPGRQNGPSLSRRLAQKDGPSAAGTGVKRKQKAIPAATKKQSNNNDTEKSGINATPNDHDNDYDSNATAQDRNSWQKQIKREENKSVSWLDWLMCGQCSCTDVDKERQSAMELNRAPQRMDSAVSQQQQQRLQLNNSQQNSNSLNQQQAGGDCVSQGQRSGHSSQMFNRQHQGLKQPRYTNEELDRAIFHEDHAPPSGILKNNTRKASTDYEDQSNPLEQIKSAQAPSNNEIETRQQAKSQQHEGQHDQIVGGQQHGNNINNEDDLNLSSNLMMDIDEATPVSNQTALQYTDRENKTQHARQNSAGQDFSTKFEDQQKSKSAQVDKSEDRVSETPPPVTQEETVGYQADQNIVHEDKSPNQNWNQNAAGESQTKNNFETNNDSSISSDKSIPEENDEESSCQLLTSQSRLSQIVEDNNQRPANETRGGTFNGITETKLTYSETVQTTEKANNSVVKTGSIVMSQQRPSYNSQVDKKGRVGSSFRVQNQDTTQNDSSEVNKKLVISARKGAKDYNPSQTVVQQFNANSPSKLINVNENDVSQSGYIAEEHTPTVVTNHEMEDDSSCQQFARLEQQIKDNAANGQNSNRLLVIGTNSGSKVGSSKHMLESSCDQEVVIVSTMQGAQMMGGEGGHHLGVQQEQNRLNESLDEFQRFEAMAEQEAKLQQHMNNPTRSQNSTPVDPHHGPRATTNVKRHSVIEETAEGILLKEQIESGVLTPRNHEGIHFEINQFDSLNRSRQELVFSDDDGNKQSYEKLDGQQQKQHMSTSESKKQGKVIQDSSDSGLINIQTGHLQHNPEHVNKLPTLESQLDEQSASDKPPLSSSRGFKSAVHNQQRMVPPRAYTSKQSPTNLKSAKASAPNKNSTTKLKQPSQLLAQPRRSAQQNKTYGGATQNSSMYGGFNKKRQSVNISNSEKKTHEITTTEDPHSIEINSTNRENMHRNRRTSLEDQGLQQQNHQNQQQLGVKSQRSQQQLRDLTRSGVQNRQKSLSINDFSLPTKPRTQSVMKPTVSSYAAQSQSHINLPQKARLDVGAPTKNHSTKKAMDALFNKFGKVKQIDLRVNKFEQRNKSLNSPKVIVENTEQDTEISSAMRELARSLRSESQRKVIQAHKDRSKSRKSLLRDPSFSGTQNSQLQDSQSLLHIKQSKLQNSGTSFQAHASLSVSALNPQHVIEEKVNTNNCTDIYSETNSQSQMTAQRQTPSQKYSANLSKKLTPRGAGKRSSSGRRDLEAAMVKYSSGAHEFDLKASCNDAIKELRNSFSSRGGSIGRTQKPPKHNQSNNQGYQQNSNSDIMSNSTPVNQSQKHQHDMNNTSRISGKKIDLRPSTGQEIHSSLIQRNRSATQQALKKAPMPRMYNTQRRSNAQFEPPQGKSPAKKLSETSRMTAVFGQIKNSPDKVKQMKEEHQNQMKVLLDESAEQTSHHLLDRQKSMLQQQKMYDERQRSFKVKQQAIPSADDMNRFKSYQNTQSRMSQAQNNAQKVAQARQRSGSNIRASNASPQRKSTTQRTRVTGFFAAQGSGRRSVTKDQTYQQNGGPMFNRGNTSMDSKNNVNNQNRSETPKRATIKRPISAIRDISRRSVSVMHERRPNNASKSPSRLSKIMSQRELSAAKDYRVQEPAKFTKSALRGRGSPESRGSYHSAVRLGETATTPRNQVNKQKLKPSVPRFTRQSNVGMKAAPLTARQSQRQPQIVKKNTQVGLYQTHGLALPGITRTVKSTQQLINEEPKTGANQVQAKVNTGIRGQQQQISKTGLRLQGAQSGTSAQKAQITSKGASTAATTTRTGKTGGANRATLGRASNVKRTQVTLGRQ